MSEDGRRRSHAERREDRLATRDRIVRAGLGSVLEQGWTATSVDKVLSAAGVPKGSFYYYFPSKDEFGLALVESYQSFYLKRLARCFGPRADGAVRTFAQQLQDFLAESIEGMRRFRWRRGCLVGALGQELGALHPRFRKRLEASLQEWEAVLAGALRAAQDRSEVHRSLDPDRFARSFWAAWEGAVLRVRLGRDPEPLARMIDDFLCLVRLQEQTCTKR